MVETHDNSRFSRKPPESQDSNHGSHVTSSTVEIHSQESGPGGCLNPHPDADHKGYTMDVLEFIKQSPSFGGLFLGSMLFWALFKSKDQKFPSLVFKVFPCLLTCGISICFHRPQKDSVATSALLLDSLMLVFISLAQIVLCGIFLYAIMKQLALFDGNVFCIESGKDSTVNNCFYLTLLVVYLLQAFVELKDTINLYWMLLGREDTRMTSEASNGSHTMEGIPAKTKNELSHLLRQLLRQHKFSALTDMFFHIFGWHLLVGISVLAMFFQGPIGSMIVNAAAVMYLEQLDDELKRKVLSFPIVKGILKDWVISKGQDGKNGSTNEDARPVNEDARPVNEDARPVNEDARSVNEDARCENEDARCENEDGEHHCKCSFDRLIALIADFILHVVVIFHFLCFLTVVGLIIYLAYQTGIHCRLADSDYKIFG